MMLFSYFNGPEKQLPPHHHLPQHHHLQHQTQHPVSWKVSSDGSILVGHMILTKSFRSEPFGGSSAAVLGLRVVGGQITEAGTIGAVIEKVKKGSIADTVGKLRPGDEVLEWNGRSLQGLTFEEVYDIISESRHEPQIELIVCRVNIRPAIASQHQQQQPIQPPFHLPTTRTSSPLHMDLRSRLSASSPTSWSPAGHKIQQPGISMMTTKRQLPQVPPVSRMGSVSGHYSHPATWDHVMSTSPAVGVAGAFDPLMIERSSGASLHTHHHPHPPHVNPALHHHHSSRLPTLPLTPAQRQSVSAFSHPHQRRMSHLARTLSAGDWMTPPVIYSDSDLSARPTYTSDKMFYAHPVQRPLSATGRQRSRPRYYADRETHSLESPDYRRGSSRFVTQASDASEASSGRKSREDLRRESLEFVPRQSRVPPPRVVATSDLRRGSIRFEGEEENYSETSSPTTAAAEEKVMAAMAAAAAASSTSSVVSRTTQVKHQQQQQQQSLQQHFHPTTLSSTASLGESSSGATAATRDNSRTRVGSGVHIQRSLDESAVRRVHHHSAGRSDEEKGLSHGQHQEVSLSDTAIGGKTASEGQLNEVSDDGATGSQGEKELHTTPGAKAKARLGDLNKAKSSSTSQLSQTGTKKRLGFRKKNATTFSVHRSEEIAPHEVRHLVKQTSSTSSDGDNSLSGESGWIPAMRLQTEGDMAVFVEGLGPGQLVGRQALASVNYGDIQLSIGERKGCIEVEVIRARNLTASGSRLPATYVKVYMWRKGKCVAKARTTLARRTLDPLYQQQLIFHEDYREAVLQITVWGDYGKLDKKVFMGMAQVVLDELDLSNIVIGWYKLLPPSTVTLTNLAPSTALQEAKEAQLAQMAAQMSFFGE